MDFISIAGSPQATSYASLREAQTYLAARASFDESSWLTLSDPQQEQRLMLAARFVDTQNYRGMAATVCQSLKFPRLMPGDPLFVEYKGVPMPYASWEDLVEYAALKSVPLPDIPWDIKAAQIEIAFQVVHSHLLTLGPMESGEMNITSLGIDVINLSFGSSGRSAMDLFPKDLIGASTPISLYLSKYLTSIRGNLI